MLGIFDVIIAHIDVNTQIIKTEKKTAEIIKLLLLFDKRFVYLGCSKSFSLPLKPFSFACFKTIRR